MAEQTAKGPARTIELSKLEQSAARRVAEAKATIPHLVLEADARPPAPGRAAATAACGRALAEHPRLNATYRDGRIEAHSRANVAVSLAVGELVVAPTIFDADRKLAGEIEAELAELEERARRSGLSSPELSGATFTVVDLAGTGAVAGTGIVTPGQAGTLVFGDPVDASVRVVLACDARVAPWPVAAPFLATVKAQLESGG